MLRVPFLNHTPSKRTLEYHVIIPRLYPNLILLRIAIYKNTLSIAPTFPLCKFPNMRRCAYLFIIPSLYPRWM